MVIPTMQREAFLEETLTHLSRTSYPHYLLEVFIVDGGSTDRSEEIVRKLNDEVAIDFRWHSDPSLRVTLARNYAVKHTEAEVLVFLDDDCITRTDWIATLIDPLLKGEVDITGGPDRAPDDDPFLARCEDVAFRSIVGSGGVRGSSGPSLTGFAPMTCNMAMKRETFFRLGGFDETMRQVEDTDFIYKARLEGLKEKYVPEAIVLHRRRASLKSICYHNYIRGCGRTYLWRKYPTQPQSLFFLPTLAGFLILVFGLGGFVFPSLWALLGLECIAYVILLSLVAFEALCDVRHPMAAVITPVLVLLHHFWYAVGTLIGPLKNYGMILIASDHRSDPFGRELKVKESPENRPVEK
ncbi:MAG: glycosyltransferase [Verrucomicrobiota bacterium]